MGAWILLLLLAAPADRADEAARRVLSDTGYQTELPDGSVLPDPPSDPGVAGQIEPTGAFATIARLVFWILAGVVVVVALLWLARALAARYEKKPQAAAAPVAAASKETPPVLVDPEALAGAGRYGEAIHALLLRVLVELKQGAKIRPAWTSREIVTHVPLADPARDGLRGLVDAVERTHFGGAPADAAEYRRRAEDTEALLAGLVRGSRG